MLSFTGGPAKNCDGLSRRSFLRVGSLGIGGLSLADLIRAESASDKGSSSKSIIHIHLDGGPPQMDMIDPKPDSPVEYRGDIKSIPSEIPGVHLSDLMPRVAGSAKKFAFIRSLVRADGQLPRPIREALPGRDGARGNISVSYTHLTLPTNREV